MILLLDFKIIIIPRTNKGVKIFCGTSSGTKMRKTIQVCITLLLINIKGVVPLKSHDAILKEKRNENALLLSKVVQLLVESKLRTDNRRALNADSLAKARNYYNKITKNMGVNNNKPHLRDSNVEVKDDQAILIENELKNALTHQKSALYDRPYVEKHGKNDFLVMRPEIFDPFVTVVPNHIYYDAEKKCVNWLDDCSLQGIRQRLLRGANSPYK